MTRKRVQDDLTRCISEDCSYCDGRGYTLSRTTVVYNILREVRRESTRNQQAETIFVNANPAVADLLYGEEHSSLEQLEGQISKRVVIRALGHYHLERYEVYHQ